jgi:bacillithiol system protein YtxJ
MIPIQDFKDLEDAIQNSYAKPSLIFKHSTRCPISAMAFSRVKSGLDKVRDVSNVYYLDIIKLRDISNEVAQRFEVTHESPQVLLIRNGKCIYHTSHNAISPSGIIAAAL